MILISSPLALLLPPLPSPPKAGRTLPWFIAGVDQSLVGGRKGKIFGGDLSVTCLDLCFDCVMSDVFHSFFLPFYSLKVNWSNSTRLLCIFGDKITSMKSHSQQQDISSDSSSTPNSSLTFALGNIVWESSVANSCIGQLHETGQQAYLDHP